MSPLARASLVLAALTPALACHESKGSSEAPPFLELGLNDLGIETEVAFLAEGAVVAWVPERDGDRNGDGDTSDVLLEVLSLADGRRTVVPFAFSASLGTGGGFVSFLVPEREAQADLNSDGDREDLVAHLLRVRDGQVLNLRLAVGIGTGVSGFQMAHSGALVVLGVSELAQDADLDGDGDRNSSEVFVYEADRGRSTWLGRGIAHPPVVSGRRAVLVSDELTEGDLNGDLDQEDQVAWLYEADLGRIVELRRAAQRVLLDGAMLALESCECNLNELTPAGPPDLNGNGVPGDVFVELYDLESRFVRIATPDTAGVWGLGGDLALLRSVDPQGRPGLAVYDRFTDAQFPLGEVGPLVPLPTFEDRRVAFSLNELSSGQDLNGDGVLADDVLHVFDARSGLLSSTRRLTLSTAQFSRNLVAFLSRLPTVTELPPATVVLLQDLRSGAILRQHPVASDFRLADRHVVLTTPEQLVESDLNGDGDLLDEVVQVYDLATGETTNLRLALHRTDFPTPFEIEGDVVLFSVSEEEQGADLDGDGALDDFLLYALRLPEGPMG